MNIGEAAKASGVTAKMIRYYESTGLLRPAARRDNGYRDYGAIDVHELRFIRRARGLGFDMAEIAELLSLWRDRGRTSRDVHRVASGHIEALQTRIVELQGTTGSSPAIDRKKGFEQGIAGHDNLKIVQSQTGDFTRSLGKEVMESFLQAENGGKDICALYAHNDDMAVGAIQAIKEGGLKPGSDIKVVSIDAVPDIFLAMAAGEANATVELTPNMAGPAFDALKAYLADGTAPPKWIQTESKLFTQADDPQAVYESKKDLGY